MKIVAILACLGLLAAAPMGCSFVTCADLQEVCNRCSASDKDLCEITANTKDDQACSNVLVMFETKCP